MSNDSWFEEYRAKVLEALSNESLRKAVQEAQNRYWKARKKTLSKTPYYEYYRKKVREARTWALNHLDELLKMVKENVEAQGGAFYLAKTGEDANRYILNALSNHDAKLVVKSKSSVTEEIDLNKYLSDHGIEVVETDLGEFIVQVLGQKRSHPILPAIHLRISEIAEAISKVVGKELPPDPTVIADSVRNYLRKKYFEADAGITGANVIAADTGAVYLIENEGNIRFVSNAPPVHIAVTGMEKIVPTMEDAMDAVRLMIPNATGQDMTAYVSIVTGPSKTSDIELRTVMGMHGPKEYHLVLLDNGRTEMLNDPVFKEALLCLHCGACLNVCPVFRQLSGQVWGYKYLGGSGAPWVAFLFGWEKAAPIAYSCLMCGRCKEVCPMGIDIPGLVLKLRERLYERGLVPPPLKKIIDNLNKYGNPGGKH